MPLGGRKHGGQEPGILSVSMVLSFVFWTLFVIAFVFNNLLASFFEKTIF
jgi:hypothetical protein